jgi:hypothetical protein
MPRTYPLAVVGLRHRNWFRSRAKYVAKHVEVGDPVTLKREPRNPDDMNAVAVRHRRFKVGYIPSGSWVAASIDRGDKHAATVAAVEIKGWWLWKRAVGLTIDISILNDPAQ